MHLNRLKKRKEFLAVASAGHKVVTTTMVLQAKQSEGRENARAGFTVTKKVGNSVVRNRIRRRLRAAAGEVLNVRGEAGVDYVLIGRKQTLDAPFDVILRDLNYGVKRIHKQFSASDISPSLEPEAKL